MRIREKRTYTFREVDRLCDELAAKIIDFTPDYVISIESGGCYPGKKVASQLGTSHLAIMVRRPLVLPTLYDAFPRRLVFIPALLHAIAFLVVRPVLMTGLLPAQAAAMRGKRILLVDDVVQSGRTLDVARKYLATLCSGEVRTAVITNIAGARVNYGCSRGLRYFPWSRCSKEYDDFVALYPSLVN